MSSKKELQKILSKEIEKVNISTLADRPNSGSRYGVGDLTAQMLKERFDAFPNLVKDRLNAIVDALISEDASKYITIPEKIPGVDNLFDFLALFCEKETDETNISDYIEALYTAVTDTVPSSRTLQEIVNDMSERIVALRAFAESNEERLDGAEDRLDDHDNRIEIMEEYINEALVEETSVSDMVIVPEKSKETAKILSVGGLSYKTENLIPFPYLGTKGAGHTETTSGLTYTVNADGGIHIEGTATASSTFFLVRNLVIPTKTSITISGSSMNINVNARKFTADGADTVWFESAGGRSRTSELDEGEKVNFVGLYIVAGKTVNETVYPMLNYGTTALPYKPCFAGLRHTKVTEIKSEGANLIPFPYLGTKGAGFNETINGLTWSINADGIIRVVGTSENAPTFRLWEKCKVSLNSPIAICGYIKYGASSERVDFMCRKTTITGTMSSFLSDSGSLGTNNKLTAEVNDGETFDYVGIYIAPGRTVDATIYPMLNYGETASPYKPYKAEPLDTLTIPTSAQDLDGYGVGVNAGYHNYIEFTKGKVLYHKVCEKIVFDGTENWLASDTVTEGVWRCYLEHGLGLWYKDTMTVSPAICNKYESVSASGTYNAKRGLTLTRNDLYIYDENYNTSDISLWKAHLAQLYASGDPITAVVVLAEPIVTDVTHLFSGDNVLNVESGGYLTFENEYKYAVPSSVEWRIESSHRVAFEHSQTKGNPHETTAAEVGAYSKEETDALLAERAPLVEGKVPSDYLPSYVDDVLEFEGGSEFPNPGESGKIYVAKDTNKSYRWSGSTYVQLTSSQLILGETYETAFRGDLGKAAYDHSQIKNGNPHGTKMSDIVSIPDTQRMLLMTDGSGGVVFSSIHPSMLPSYVDDVIEGTLTEDGFTPEYYDGNEFNDTINPDGTIEPKRGKIYLDITTGISYRWSGSQYTPITDKELPPVSSADDGKILQVVGGKWAAAEILNAEGGSF